MFFRFFAEHFILKTKNAFFFTFGHFCDTIIKKSPEDKKMNVYIMADLEGISGIYCREQVTPDQRRFDEGRRFLTREINICAEACKAAGVEKDTQKIVVAFQIKKGR